MTREYALALVSKTEAKNRGQDVGGPDADISDLEKTIESEKPQVSKKKKSRWSDEPAKVILPPPPLLSMGSPAHPTIPPVFNNAQTAGLSDESDNERKSQDQ